MRAHEDILVFYNQFNTYNPQMGEGKAYDKGKALRATDVYGSQVATHVKSAGGRYPRSVVYFKTPESEEGGSVHPTQKPVALMEYLIRTYSNEGDVVLDCCMGSGTTGVASVIQKRKFIGIEKDPMYFNIALERINKAHLQQSLFEYDPMERFFSK